jgi:hypothetical protein
MKFIILLTLSFNAYALEVTKFERPNDFINLKIIRVEVDSFDTYILTNQNLIEMDLVCANNVVYDYNPTAIIRYKNYYNLPVFDFIIENNIACKQMGKFIETTFMAVDEERPFLIRLNTKTGKVASISYPNIDPNTESGEIEDLLPKKRLFFKVKAKRKLKIKIQKN